MFALVSRGEIWSAWTAEPFTIGAAFGAAFVYGWGLYATGVRAVGRGRAAAFVGGIAVALLAMLSPLQAAVQATFSSHMSQHMVLMFVAAPLLVAGRPGLVMGLALPRRVRRWSMEAARSRPVAVALRLARHPLAILVVYTTVVWAWHLPGPYQAAIRSGAVHGVEHASFLAVAMAFWAGVTRTGPRRRIRYVPSMLLVLGTMLQSTWLAAILTFGGRAYPLYAQRAAAWRIDALADQQLAGAIMWIPPSILYLTVFSVLFVRWLRELGTRHAQRPAPAVQT